MNAIFWGFLLWLLISNHYLRMMIKDAYRYKKTNQQVREFENWYFSGEKKRSILLPYRELAKNCSAPRHMKFFQMMRRINWCVIIVGLFYVRRIMSLKRPAAGGESCKAGFFLTIRNKT